MPYTQINKAAAFLALFAISVTVAIIARVLCFEATSIGGYAYWFVLSAGPFIGWIARGVHDHA